MYIKKMNIFLCFVFLATNIKAADKKTIIDLTQYRGLVDAQSKALKAFTEQRKREDLTDLNFWGKLSYEKNRERFEKLEGKKNAIQAVIGKGTSAIPAELQALMDNLTKYTKNLNDNEVTLVMTDFKCELSRFEKAVQDEVNKLEASLVYMSAIAERADDPHWAHDRKENEICQQCETSGAKVSFCMGCEKQCCGFCDNILALPSKLSKMGSKVLLCASCAPNYSRNIQIYEYSIFSVKAKQTLLAQQETLEELRRLQSALLLRKELLKGIEDISGDLRSFSIEYVEAADELQRSIRARLSLMEILYAAGTGKNSTIPALGAVAGKALLKISKGDIFAVAAKSLPFIAIALVNGYSAYNDTEKIGKYCLIAACQLGACIASGGSNLVVNAIAVWATGALTDAGYEIYLINDAMAWRAIVEKADQCAEISKNASKEFIERADQCKEFCVLF